MTVIKEECVSKFGSKVFSSRSPRGEGYWPYVFFVLLGLMTADLAVTSLRTQFLPTQAPPTKPAKIFVENSPGRGAYQVIVTRNLFSGDNIIPDPLQIQGLEKGQELPPVLSSLPLALVGTLVHSNSEKSLAAIDVKGKNQVLSFSIKQEIDGMAVLEKIERGRIVFRNNNNGRLEFIELPQSTKVAFESGKSNTESEIKQVAENQYELKKSDLEKHLSNLPDLLMQARAVPARRPGTGETYGFRVLEVQPGSVLSNFVKPMDVITAANGSPVTSVQQAMELFNAMRNSNRVCITVETDGRSKEKCYNIK